jgi:hypothetical protein
MASLAVKHGVNVEQLDKKTPHFEVPILTWTQKANRFQEEWNVSKKCAWFSYEPLIYLLPVTESRGSRNMATEQSWGKWNKFILTSFSVYLRTRLFLSFH